MIKLVKFSNNRIDNIIYYIFCALPVLLITGPFLSDLALVFISFYSLFKIKNNSKYFFLINNKYFVIFTLFCLNSLIVTLYNYFKLPSDSKDFDTVINSIFYFRYFLFSIGVIILILENKKVLNYFFVISFLCLGVFFIDAFYQFFFKANIFGLKISPDERVSSFFGDELIMGSYSLRIFLLIFPIYFLFKKDIKYKKLFIPLLLLITFSLIVISGERSSIILFFLTILMYVFFTKISFKNILKFSISFLILFLVLLRFEAINNRLIDRTILETNNKQKINNSIQVKFFGQQLLYFATAYNIFKSNPLGVGNKNYKNYCLEFRADINRSKEFSQSCSSHPHNIYMQVLAENGAQGLLIICILFFYILFEILKTLRMKFFNNSNINQFEIYLSIALFVNFFPLMQHGSFFNNWISIFYYLSISFYIFSKLNQK